MFSKLKSNKELNLKALKLTGEYEEYLEKWIWSPSDDGKTANREVLKRYSSADSRYTLLALWQIQTENWPAIYFVKPPEFYLEWLKSSRRVP